jgi:3-hydroxypropionyl-CoA synthetase (ADP-forming)
VDKFFYPHSVAVIGASSKPGKIGYEILRNLVKSGYDGKIYPIHPKDDYILDVRCYKSIEAVDTDIDLAVIVLSATQVPDAIEACGRKGVKHVIIVSSGFKELGREGKKLEAHCVAIAHKYGIRIIGPNCIGVYNSANKLDTFFQPLEAMVRPEKGSIAVLTQSGTYGVSLLEWLASERLGVSKFVSYGNKCDVTELDMLKYLENDDSTNAIAMYIEDLKSGKEFFNLAIRVTKKKPIIALKSGISEEGASAAQSHTGALAGDGKIFMAALKQCGVIAVDDLDDMLDILKICLTQPLPNGGGIGMVTNGAGPCVVAVDAIARTSNLSVAALSDESVQKLEATLPSYCIRKNPIDITGSADAGMYEKALKILAEDINVHILMPFFVFQDAPLAVSVKHLYKVLADITRYGKTLVCVAAGGRFTEMQKIELQERKIPVLPTSHRAINALSKILDYSDWLSRTTKM